MANYFDKALADEGVTGEFASFVRSIYGQESGHGRNTGKSTAGASGPMQLMPGTFKEVADKGWDINNKEHNTRAGIRYLKQMNKIADGDLRLTAIGYYGGPGGIKAAKQGVARSDKTNPNAPNTFQYADQVMARMGKGAPTQARAGTAPVASDVPSTQVAQQAPSQSILDTSGILPGLEGWLKPQEMDVSAVPTEVAQQPSTDPWSDYLAGLQSQQPKVQASVFDMFPKAAPDYSAVLGALVANEPSFNSLEGWS